MTKTNYKYDGANVVIMLDFSGSISGEWVEEVESAEMVIDFFKKNMSAQSPFRAAAIRWGKKGGLCNSFFASIVLFRFVQQMR